MRVSVLIPTLNREGYLREALTSVRAQTHADLEILVSDDGSRDGTRDFVTALSREIPRVKLLTGNPTPGIFTNMNYLVAQSSGDAFCLLGDDDLLAPTFVSKLVAPFETDESVVASFCDHGVIDAAGRRHDDATDESSRRYGRDVLAAGVVADPVGVAFAQSFCIGFALFRASTFRAEPFDLACGGAADIDYVLRAIARGSIYFVPGRLGDYRAHPGTATHNKRLYMLEGILHVLGKHVFPPGPNEDRRRALIRDQSRFHAFHSCAVDQPAALASVGRYLKLGGSLLDARIVVSTALALAPARVARWVHGELLARHRSSAQTR